MNQLQDYIVKRDTVDVQIKKLEAVLKPLLEERKKLNKIIKEESKITLSFSPNGGLWFKGKDGDITCIYFNYTDRTLYLKPLYKPNGQLYGGKTSKKYVEEEIAYYLQKGFKIAE